MPWNTVSSLKVSRDDQKITQSWLTLSLVQNFDRFHLLKFCFVTETLYLSSTYFLTNFKVSIDQSLTPTLAAWLLRSHWPLKSILWETYFWISCKPFRYYPYIHFYSHFWNQCSCKKIPCRKKKILDTKNISFSKLD